MATTFTELDAAARMDAYRLEPGAALPSPSQVLAAATALGLVLPDDYVDQCCRFGAMAYEKRACITLPAGCPIGEQFWLDIVFAVGAKPELAGSSTDLFYGLTSTAGNYSTAEIQEWQRLAGLTAHKIITYRTLPGRAMVVAKKK